MKVDSRLFLLAVVAAGIVALVWSWAGEGAPDPVPAPQTTLPAPEPSSAGSEPNAVPSESAAVTTTSGPAATTVAIPVPEVLAETHPRLVDIDGWLQSEVESIEELRGRVVIVEFWTFGCYNCKNRIPHTREIYDRYRDRGLEIVGVHSPEFEFEEDVDNVRQALVDLGVTWPVALDTRRRTFWEWQGGPRAYWPRTYVLDREGRVRFDHIGEGKYRELEQTVAFLLDEQT